MRDSISLLITLSHDNFFQEFISPKLQTDLYNYYNFHSNHHFYQTFLLALEEMDFTDPEVSVAMINMFEAIFGLTIDPSTIIDFKTLCLAVDPILWVEF
jgi:hypothetical protein